MDPIESVEYKGFEISNCNSHVDHGWKEIVYPKRNRKQKPMDQTVNGGVPGKVVLNGNLTNGDNVFRLLMDASDVEDESARNENLKREETKKPKPKTEKKPKVSFPEAAAKIDPSDLAAYLAEVSKMYSAEPEVRLLRFCKYFGNALSGVQLPWVKMFFKESPFPKLVDVIDVPISYIPEPVYKISVDWIHQVPILSLAGFVTWAFRHILIYLAAQIGEKGAQPIPSKSYEAVLVALAMVLRRKPNALTIVLEELRENPRYQGEPKLPVIVWMMAQASQGDLSVGLYSWAHNLLPVVGSNPQSRDLILQFVEKILSNPEARTILVNGVVREGERLIPPPSFEILLRLTFPASSARVKATERFEAIYPLLKEVALSVAPVSNAMKQVTQQIFTSSLKVAGEGNPVLAEEATAIAIWSLTENVDCCKHWDDLYEDNLEASVALLKKLVDEWKDHSLKLSSSPSDTLTLNQTMKSFRLKNENAMAEGGGDGSLYKEANESCKVISGRLSRGSICLKGTSITAVVLAAAAAAAAVVLSSNPEATTELKNLVDSLELRLYVNAITTALRKKTNSCVYYML